MMFLANLRLSICIAKSESDKINCCSLPLRRNCASDCNCLIVIINLYLYACRFRHGSGVRQNVSSTIIRPTIQLAIRPAIWIAIRLAIRPAIRAATHPAIRSAIRRRYVQKNFTRIISTNGVVYLEDKIVWYIYMKHARYSILFCDD